MEETLIFVSGNDNDVKKDVSKEKEETFSFVEALGVSENE